MVLRGEMVHHVLRESTRLLVVLLKTKAIVPEVLEVCSKLHHLQMHNFFYCVDKKRNKKCTWRSSWEKATHHAAGATLQADSKAHDCHIVSTSSVKIHFLIKQRVELHFWLSAKIIQLGEIESQSKWDFLAPRGQEQSGAVEACWAHNPEVRGSKPCSANFLTIFSNLTYSNFLWNPSFLN